MYNTRLSEKFPPRPIAPVFLVVVSMVLASCAGQRPPQGGPPDTTPPEIILSAPAAGATNVRTKTVHLEFSEYVDRRSLEQAVFVSPPVGQLEFSWGGTDVDILIPDSLKPQTTYIFSIGTDVVDLRNKNRMAATFALPFSTGDHIDSGKIAGTVYDPKPGGVFIFAYRLTAGTGDTLNPAHTKPDFVTQTGNNGTFTLTNLPLGTFRLLAVRDELRNLLYDVQTDAYGVLPGDVVLAPGVPSVAGVAFQLTQEDTARPFLSSAKSIFRSSTLLKFSEPVDPSTVNPDSIAITDTVSRKPVALDEAALDYPTRLQLAVTHLPLDTSHAYEVTVTGVRDDHGNRITAGNVLFTPVSTPDTSKLTMDLVGIADSSVEVAPDDTLLLAFSRSIRRAPFEHGFSIMTARRTALAGALVWFGSSAARFVPAAALEPGAMYHAAVARDSVQGVNGGVLRDSVWARTFRVLDDRKLSSISGKVIDSGKVAGPAVVTAAIVDARKARKRTVVADAEGGFAFPLLPEGRYALSVYRDADTNGHFSYGLPYPFVAAERFAVFADSVKLRARWPMEGVLLRMK